MTPGAPDDGQVTDDFQLAGVPDGFQRLWNPHRMAYVSKGQDQVKDTHTCPFCAAPSRSDEDALIVFRGESCYALLNLYPYNPGHLLVCPYRHVPGYVDLTERERAEFGDLTARAVRVLTAVSKPHGFNMGMNQGDVAGAGIAAHLHQHVVPRWGGDANFFPVIAQTKALPQVLGETRSLIADGWERADTGREG